MSALPDLLATLDGAASLNADQTAQIHDAARLRAGAGELARAATFGTPEVQAAARWLLWTLAQASGIRPASIHDLYLARGRGAVANDHTVPAMNLRVMTYDCARAVFRAAQTRRVGAMIFEIARSEIGYTDQRPAEYLANVAAAALAEGFSGPLFIQGDHFQVAAKRYGADPDAELKAVDDLTREAIGAGFFNIDVDTSTLVDLDLPTLRDQQRLNAGLCARFTRHIRALEPAGVTVSVGGEIGEVGGKNSTEAELRAFMDEYADALGQDGHLGLSKISIQTGTSHGGVVLPDGTLAQVKVDFDTLARLSKVAREEYGLGGAVQHGASTLPENAFSRFADAGACEVHLATNFQNMAYDRFPAELKDEIYGWIKANKADQKKATETEEQFLYNNRKHAIGPFKHAAWSLPEALRSDMRAAWEAQFAFLFEQLNVVNTRELVAQFVHPPTIERPLPEGAEPEAQGGEDISDLAD